MGRNAIISRRSLLRGGAASFSLLFSSQNLWLLDVLSPGSHFSTEYTIDVSRLAAVARTESEFLDKITEVIVHSGFLDNAWFDKYNDLKNTAFRNGSLVKSEPTLSADKMTLTFCNTWKDMQSFLTFFKESDSYKLDDAFMAAGFAPNLKDIYEVFPDSPNGNSPLRRSKRLS